MSPQPKPIRNGREESGCQCQSQVNRFKARFVVGRFEMAGTLSHFRQPVSALLLADKNRLVLGRQSSGGSNH